MTRSFRRTAASVMAGATLAVAGCGGDDEQSEPTRSAAAAAAPAAADLGAIKDYLLEHTALLKGRATTLRKDAEAYHRLAAAADFDYARLLEGERAEVAALVSHAQRGFAEANPAYEQMEGVVAGVPELADFDVIIDAGGDASDPETAVPFDIETPAGRTFEQPGNFNFLIETSLFGTEPSSRPRASSPISTATVRSSSARRCPTPTSSSRSPASSSATSVSSTPPRARGSRLRRMRSPRSW